MIFISEKRLRMAWRCRWQNVGVLLATIIISSISFYAGLYGAMVGTPTSERIQLESPLVTSVEMHSHEDEKKSVSHNLVPKVPRSQWVRYPDQKWYGHPLPVLTSRPLGRMGNVMGEYATLYALSRLYNVTAFVIPEMRRQLPGFTSLSLPELPVPFVIRQWSRVGKSGGLSSYNYTNIEFAAAGVLGPKPFVLVEYPFEMQLFNALKDDLRKEFTFRKEIKLKAEEFVATLRQKWKSKSNSTAPPVLVGFHVRRTDYVMHAMRNFGARLPEDKYFSRALAYYRDKFPNNVAFIVASDDRYFVRVRLGRQPDVYFSNGDTPGEDMAILSSCDHSIITMGSFGFWTGYLTGGEVVYPDVSLQRNYRFSRAMFEKAQLANFTPLPPD